MKQLNIYEIKTELIKMMTTIDLFCRNHGIQYSLAYGTLLGAVRHKGFIPWDDDIDIMMTRKNYDIFIQKWNDSNSNLKLLTNNDPNYNLLFSKIYNPKILIEPKMKDRYMKKQYLFIDIFPIDYLCDNIEEGKRIISKSNFDLCILIAAQWKHFYINNRHNFLRQIPRFVFYLLSRFVNSKHIIKKLNKNIKDVKSKYSYCIALNRAKYEFFESTMFENYTNIEFENHDYMSICDYDANLKVVYGNYMTLPPKNKRILPHSYKAFYL